MLKRSARIAILITAGALAIGPSSATAQVALTGMTKAQVGDLIRKVEDGVDEFNKYLERRGEDARGRVENSGATAESARENTSSRRSSRGRRTRQNQPSSETTAARRAAAADGADELEEALDDLNGSTNRLRRRFVRANDYLETKVQTDRVVDDGRKINQVMTRGGYNSEVKRLWGVLRAAINELARAYNITPMGL
jgi:hypothetical protein